MPRIRLDLPRVTASALAVVDEHGFDALSLSAVALHLGVGPSALYTHVAGLDGLRSAVAVESTRHLTADVRDAAIGTAGGDALQAVGRAYRTFAEDHPGRFASTLQANVEGPAIELARGELDSVFLLLYRSGGVPDPAAGAAARYARSTIHGFLTLQHTGAGGDFADEDYDLVLENLCRILPER